MVAVTSASLIQTPSTRRRSYRARLRWTPASVVTVPEVPSRCISARSLAMLGGERSDMFGDLLHHPRIGLRRDVAAAKMLGQRDDAERDRHPRLDARRRILFTRIALDPNQFGRSAADIEQNGAPSVRIEQRRAADHGERCFGLAVDHFEADAGLRGDPIAKTFGIRRGAAGLGRDQPQPPGLPGLDLVAANAQRGDGALDRGVADTAGRGDSLAQPDDPRERIRPRGTRRRSGTRSAGDNYWCRGRAPRRRRHPAPTPPLRHRLRRPVLIELPRDARSSRSRVSSFIQMSFPGP